MMTMLRNHTWFTGGLRKKKIKIGRYEDELSREKGKAGQVVQRHHVGE